MRLTAIYGANGAGKSNLVKALQDLKNIVAAGSITRTVFQSYKFQLSKSSLSEPVSMALEFSTDGVNYYYSIEMDTGIVSYESLSISHKTKDILVFERKSNGSQTLKFGEGYSADKSNKLFANVLQDKLLGKEALLLSFMAVNYPDEMPSITNAYRWIINDLIVLNPKYLKNLALAYFFSKNPGMNSLLQDVLSGTKTGITSVEVGSRVVDESQLDPGFVKGLKDAPGVPRILPNTADDRINNSIVYENGQLVYMEIQPKHQLSDGTDIKMPINFESDGTIRLIEYIPLIYLVLTKDCVVIIDEIERSLHPILIKEIITKISESLTAKGQLIFTTHESCLLDQEILRPDEIWFAQKDTEQATQFYPLSDFNIHKTANIENGYLNGRYGGIPFLSNLNDLHW
ncbi:MAG: ATP-binding protein [Bacteroidales bacterium]|nr:ATP-binding protein [Bacteroidales bacterium]